MRKIICFLMCLFPIFILCTSCGVGENDGIDKFEQLLQNVGTTTETEVTLEPFADKVYVIVSENCSGELSLKANELAERIYEKTAVDAVVKYDNEKTVSSGRTLEILLGATNRIASQEAIKPLRSDDYICKWDRGYIVIGGRRDDSTLKAVGEFLTRVLPYATNSMLMDDDVRLEYSAKYEISAITLNGYDLYDFTFVYSSDTDDVEKEKIAVLREYIARKSGYLLDMAESSQLNETSGKTISVICDSDLNGATIEATAQHIVLSGSDEYSLSCAVAEFAELLFGSVSDGVASATVRSVTVRSHEKRYIRICSALSENLGGSDVLYLTDILRLVRNGDYDIVTLASVSEDVEAYIKEHLDGDCDYVVAEDSSGQRIPIIIKNGVFANVEISLKDELLCIRFKLDGEGKVQSVVRLLMEDMDEQIDTCLPMDVGDAILIFDGIFHTELNDLYFVAAEKAELFDKIYGQTVFADVLYEVGEVQTRLVTYSDSLNIFIGFSFGYKNCPEFELLKYSVK